MWKIRPRHKHEIKEINRLTQALNVAVTETGWMSMFVTELNLTAISVDPPSDVPPSYTVYSQNLNGLHNLSSLTVSGENERKCSQFR